MNAAPDRFGSAYRRTLSRSWYSSVLISPRAYRSALGEDPTCTCSRVVLSGPVLVRMVRTCAEPDDQGNDGAHEEHDGKAAQPQPAAVPHHVFVVPVLLGDRVSRRSS